MIRLTQAGKVFLGISVLLYLASLTSQSGLLLLLIGLFAGCYLVNFAMAWRMVDHLEIQTQKSIHLSEGQPITQPWRIVNRGRLPAGFIQVDSPAGPLFRLRALAANAEMHLVPELTYWKRGVYPNLKINVSSVYPFGFIQVKRPLTLPGEIVVHPAVYDVHSPRAAGYDAMVGGKFKGQRVATSGALFAGVRPLQPGDPLKHIHWKASSKGQGLMVKTFDEELSGRVSIVVDCGHSGDAKVLDDCVRAAGSLMFAALDGGHHVEWIELGRLQLELIPPFADGHEILDALARLEIAPACLTEQNLQRALALISRRSAISLVLTEFNAAARAAVEHLKNQNRIVSLYLPDNREPPADFSEVTTFSYSEHRIVECA